MLLINKNHEIPEKKGSIVPIKKQSEKVVMGSVEDINISDIVLSCNSVRESSDDVLELADSIKKIGLLSPILVRFTDFGKFEVVTGNRRLKACKTLGWKNISCYIADLDERTAFEASIIENIQRNTLNLIEEGRAFRKYVNEFGWGAISELADKLSKSASYVSKRMRLLELPDEVLQLICESEISVSAAEELLPLKEKDMQSKFAAMAANESISSTILRKMIKEVNCQEDDVSFHYHSNDKEKSLKPFDKSIVALRIAMNKLAATIEHVDNNWIIYEILMNHKRTIHSQIDLLIREKKKYIERNHFFEVNLLDDKKVTPKPLTIINVRK